jgi:hypothetical protein
MSIRDRLTKLENALANGACPACAHGAGLGRDGSRLVFCEQNAHGELVTTNGDEMPKPCPRCGQIPEALLIEEIVVVTPEQVHGVARQAG